MAAAAQPSPADLQKIIDAFAEFMERLAAYILNTAGLAVVPFYAFGAEKTSPWYRLSVGTCKKEEIEEMTGKLREALQQLS